MDFRLMTEIELKQFVEKIIEKDFHFAREVKGLHIVEKVPVRADYILRPKEHLVERGFDDEYFAIEVKSPKNSNPHAQYRKALVQAASYVDSLFSGNRPIFTLIFPHSDCFKPLNPDDVFHTHEVLTYFKIAQYFNVGDFHYKITDKNWCVNFMGGRYFCSDKGRGPHNLTKRYVGNI